MRGQTLTRRDTMMQLAARVRAGTGGGVTRASLVAARAVAAPRLHAAAVHTCQAIQAQPAAVPLATATRVGAGVEAASDHHSSHSSRTSRGSSSRYAAIVGGLIATAVVCSAAEAAADGADRAGGKKPPSPAWLGDRICAAAAAGDLAQLQSMFQAYQPAEGVNITHRFGWTPLHAAVANDRADVVEWLLAQPDVRVNQADRYSPKSASIERTWEKMGARKEAFPDLSEGLPANGFSALHYAVLLGSLRVLDLVLAAGADLDQEAHGHTADRLVNWDATRPESTLHDEEGMREMQARQSRIQAKQARLAEAREQRDEERARKEKEERLRFPLELKLKKDMVGQELPILSVAAAIRRRDNGWFDPSKPLVFLFLGSSGVGKTMLAKLVAQNVVKNPEDGFIRIDLSEYQAKHEMSRLIGSPPGYVGHEEGGQLTTKLAKCPEAVVLLDEVEKAHPDVLTLLLQVFDEGRLTDGKGTTISCPRAIFIMTSNLVQDEIRDALDNGYVLRPPNSVLDDLDQTTKKLRERGGVTTTPIEPTEKEKKEAGQTPAAAMPVPTSASTVLSGVSLPPGSSSAARSAQLTKLASDTEQFLRFIVHPILKRAFKRDEFIGRINDMVIFHPFDHRDLQHTVTTEMQRWADRAKERHSITLRWTPALVDSLTQNYDERYGYRSVIYGVEKRVVNVLASAHERDRIGAGCEVLLDVEPVADPQQQHQQAAVVIREIKQPTTEGEQGRKKFLGIF